MTTFLIPLVDSRVISKKTRETYRYLPIEPAVDMSAVLSDVDFVNYPIECWRWPYGDRELIVKFKIK